MMMFRTPDLLSSSGKDDGQRPNKDYVSVVGTWYLLAGPRTSAAWIRLSLQLCLALRYSPSGFET